MTQDTDVRVQQGSVQSDPDVVVVVLENGPYRILGAPPLGDLQHPEASHRG